MHRAVQGGDGPETGYGKSETRREAFAWVRPRRGTEAAGRSGRQTNATWAAVPSEKWESLVQSRGYRQTRRTTRVLGPWGLSLSSATTSCLGAWKETPMHLATTLGDGHEATTVILLELVQWNRVLGVLVPGEVVETLAQNPGTSLEVLVAP